MKVKFTLSILLVVLTNLSQHLYAQVDLSKLSEKERNNKLIEIARNVYQAPILKNIYRDFGTPTIMQAKTIKLSSADRKKIEESRSNIWKGSTDNQTYYIVIFHYDTDKEILEEPYAARVLIWEKTGQAFGLDLGNTISIPVKNGKIANHNGTPPPIKYYKITFSKDISNYSSLPSTAKYGQIITIELKTIVLIGNDGWTTEEGFNFSKNDVINGMIISDETKYFTKTSYTRTVKIKVMGDMTVTPQKYREEYEDMYY